MSTTKDIAVAKMYAGVDFVQEGHESAIFQLNINTNVGMHNSFADIEKNSEIRDDAEVLFTMGSVWLLKNMKWTDDYWLIELEPCDALNAQLNQLESLTNGHTFLSMGHIAHELGEYSSARNFYGRALDDEQIDNETRGHVYYYMGLLDDESSDYMTALKNYLQADELTAIPTEYDNSQASDPRPMYSNNTRPSRMQILNNTGRSYEKKGDYRNAREFYTRALNEPGDIAEKSIVYYNLGLLEFLHGKYDIARRYFTKVLQAGIGTKVFQDAQKKLQIINRMTQMA
jgi:tetratricopeptide (TPR) repeat protein